MIDVRLVDLQTIIRRHDLPVPPSLPAPWVGATSRVFPCGDVVIKIPVDQPEAIEAVRTDAAMRTFVQRLSVRTTPLVAFDDSGEIVQVPYAVFRRVRDVIPLQHMTRDDRAIAPVWESVGRDLARIHRTAFGTPVPISLREFRQSPEVDPRPWVDELCSASVLGATDARWLHSLLERLASAALADVPLRLCHGDVNAANVLVDAASGEYRALIDWAGAGWLDPVWDFAGVPLDVVPSLLAGHRSIAPLPDDHSAYARICWVQIQMRLHTARMRPSDMEAQTRLARDVSALRAFISRFASEV